MRLSPGTRLGPYEVVAALGKGGMGEVYRARDARLDRIVALKITSADLAADSTFRSRFEREARTLSSLTHPHICVLHDVGHAGAASTTSSWSISRARRSRDKLGTSAAACRARRRAPHRHRESRTPSTRRTATASSTAI